MNTRMKRPSFGRAATRSHADKVPLEVFRQMISSSFVNKMSNYCKGCRFKVTRKNGPDACPFNYLYWDFLERNRSKLRSNPRVGMMYRTYDRMSDEKKNAIREDSRSFLNAIEWKRNTIYPRKSVACVNAHSAGARSGKKYGMMSNTAPRHVRGTELVPALHPLKSACRRSTREAIFLSIKN